MTALEWLKADRAAWIKVLESHQPDARVLVRQALAQWKEDSDLAGLRDPAALGRLAQDERTCWQDFWSEVERLSRQAAEHPKP
jgi:hypothetical protein